MKDLITTDPFRYPFSFSPLLIDQHFEDIFQTNNINGLSISEDDKNVYIEASVPGIEPKEVEVTFDKGVVVIRAEKKEKEKGKSYQRRATSSFYYQVIPHNVDMKAEPSAVCKNGVMKITLVKAKGIQPKKITVKTA